MGIQEQVQPKVLKMTEELEHLPYKKKLGEPGKEKAQEKVIHKHPMGRSKEDEAKLISVGSTGRTRLW